MDRQHESEHGAAVTCYRHPDRETGIRCTRCDRPICPECMISAAVGYQCPTCVRGGSGTGHKPGANRPRTLAGGAVVGDTWLVTKILLGANLAVFVAIVVLGQRLTDELLLFGRATTGWGPLEGVAEGQWYRLLASAFAHEEIWHLAMNMLFLWLLGPRLEGALGRLRFVALYLLSALGGSTLTYVIADPQQGSLGASGAIFGLLGAAVVLTRRLQYDMRLITIVLVCALIATFVRPGIAWEAHIGGLMAGAAIAYAMVHAPRERRALVQWGACGLVLALEVAACLVRTAALTG